MTVRCISRRRARILSAACTLGVFSLTYLPAGLAASELEPTACLLDLDGDQRSDGETDGKWLVQDLLGLVSTTSDDTRACSTAFDFDANGVADALTDGLLAWRYLNGWRGAELTASTLAPNSACAAAPEMIELALSDRLVPPAPDPGAACSIAYNNPYGRVSTYPAIHGNRQNNERIQCLGPAAVTQGWSALADRMIFNMMTVSAEGDSLYAVTARTTGCKLFEVMLEDGSEHCIPREDPEALTFGVLASSPEVDRDGNIYVTDGYESAPDRIVSYTSEGELRWRTTFEGLRQNPPERYNAPFGVHFSPAGHVVTVTVDGIVLVLDRATGAILDSFDIPAETGLTPLVTEPVAIDPAKIPDYMRQRLNRVLGDLSDEDLIYALAGSTGQSGLYTDNTLAISDQGQVLVVGGGPDEATGALVALDLNETACSAAVALRWYMPIAGGSGTSPTIDPLNRFAVVGDVASRLLIADIRACNANTDADAAALPEVCEPAWMHQMEGQPLIGSVSMDENGIVYAWQQGQQAAGDLFAVREDAANPGHSALLWTTSFSLSGEESEPDWESSEWSSTVLVLDDMVVGTVMRLIAAHIEGLPLPLAMRTRHELVAIERETGTTLWRQPFPDDSLNAPLLAPDGNIYVPILGLFDLTTPNVGPLAPEFQGGIVQYRLHP